MWIVVKPNRGKVVKRAKVVRKITQKDFDDMPWLYKVNIKWLRRIRKDGVMIKVLEGDTYLTDMSGEDYNLRGLKPFPVDEIKRHYRVLNRKEYVMEMV